MASDFELPSNPGCQANKGWALVHAPSTGPENLISHKILYFLAFAIVFIFSSSFCLCFRKLLTAPKLSDICSSHGGFCLKLQLKSRSWVVLAHELPPRHGKSPQKLHFPVQTAQIQVLDYTNTLHRGDAFRKVILMDMYRVLDWCVLWQNLFLPHQIMMASLSPQTFLLHQQSWGTFQVTFQVPVTHNPLQTPECCWGTWALGMMEIIEWWRLLLTSPWASQA